MKTNLRPRSESVSVFPGAAPPIEEDRQVIYDSVTPSSTNPLEPVEQPGRDDQGHYKRHAQHARLECHTFPLSFFYIISYLKQKSKCSKSPINRAFLGLFLLFFFRIF